MNNSLTFDLGCVSLKTSFLRNTPQGFPAQLGSFLGMRAHVRPLWGLQFLTGMQVLNHRMQLISQF